MNNGPASHKARPTWLRGAFTLCRWLGSLRLAVVLLVVLAGALAVATLLEASYGQKYVQWYVYGSQWFSALLGLLGVNILASALVRFPWKRRQIGFLTTHAGVLVLLIGSMQTFLGGIEGQISLTEGDTADSIVLIDRSQLKIAGHGQSGQLSTEFSFAPGPVDWGADEPLDFGRANDVGVRVLEFYHHAAREVEWISDETGEGRAAIKLAVAALDGQPADGAWYAANPFGSPPVEGAPSIEFQQAPVPSMVDDFLDPPTEGLGEKGLLSAHCQGEVHRIPVDENVGKKVPLGDTGFSVTIIAYHANAVSEGGGQFTSLGTDPKNPLLRLEIHSPDRDQPIPEIAYARNPFVNLGLMRRIESPVTFWYHHPAVSARPGVEFLATPDEKLYCRVNVEGKYQSRGEVKVGDRIEVPPDSELSIVGYLPHARQRVTFYPVELAEGEAAGLEAAARVEISVGGETREIWLRRNDEVDGFKQIETPQGPLLVSFGYERLPLGFSLKLLDFKRGMNPGRMGDASFASEVQLVDKAEGVDERREISMNQPLVHGKFACYQSGFQEMPGGLQVSTLSVAHDPGRLLKYLGSIMTCAGIFMVYYLKGLFRGKAAESASNQEAADR